MPPTPLHYVVAYALHKFSKGRLSLPPLIVGSIMPDLEQLPLYIFMRGYGERRLILHSIIGAASIGTLLSLLLTIYIYLKNS